MHRAKSFQSAQKIAIFISALVILPAVILCSVVPSAAATEGSLKVPRKAANLVGETPKPLSTQYKPVVDVVINSNTSNSLATEDSDAVRAVDMVLLPPPLDQFTL